MAKLYDGTRTVEIEMYKRDFPDYSDDFFNTAALPYDEDHDARKVDDVDYCIDQARDWKLCQGDHAVWTDEIGPGDRRVYVDNEQILENEHIRISFEAGTARYGNHGVNYMISDPNAKMDPPLYAEIKVPEDASEDYGYFTLKDAIIAQADARGIYEFELSFWYSAEDEENLEDDAHASGEIGTW